MQKNNFFISEKIKKSRKCPALNCTVCVVRMVSHLVHGEDILLGQDLLALVRLAANLLDGLEGGVQVAGAHEVTGVKGVDPAVALEVVDVKGELDG